MILRKRPEQLADPVAMSRRRAQTRRAIRRREPKRGSGIRDAGKLRILPKARENADALIGNYEFKATLSDSVGGNACLRPRAVKVDIVLKLTERSKDALGQTAGKASGDRRILGVLRPLVPERPVFRGGIVLDQREDAPNIALTGTADGAVDECIIDHPYERWFKLDGGVRFSMQPACQRHLDKRPNASGTADTEAAIRSKVAGDSLPEQIIGGTEIPDSRPFYTGR